MAPDFCNTLGVLLILAVFAIVLPLSIPQILGYKVYDVPSSSMEPEIPLDSIVYVRDASPHDVTTDEIIAYMYEGKVWVHRVVDNHHDEELFITKGDANINEDADPVRYDHLIGVVALHVPMLGVAMSLYESTVGKVYLALTLACGIMLNVLSVRMRRRRVVTDVSGSHYATMGDGSQAARMPRQSEWIRTVVMCVLAMIFFGSGAVVLYIRHQESLASEKYDQASGTYSGPTDIKIEGIEVAPITVDFEALCKINPDVVGWIYCEDTVINYPVLQGETNDTYLRHDYLRDYNVDGSIFVDYRNTRGFVDAETIIYGHHMATGSMFAILERWEEQTFYDEHPVMWLLTPTQNYKIVLVSGHHAAASSDVYNIRHDHDDSFNQYLIDVKAQSEFIPKQDVIATPDQNYVMLSTCSYIFDNARFVVHGMLVPVVTVDANIVTTTTVDGGE